MSNIQQFPESSFSTIHCTKIIVHPTTTDLKWSTTNKHHKVVLLGSLDTAKSTPYTTSCGVVTRTGYEIGVENVSWNIIINELSNMYFGMVSLNHDVSDIDNAELKILISVNRGDRVKLSLMKSGTVSVKHETNRDVLLKTYILDVSEFSGLILYPWIATDKLESFAVKILKETSFSMDVKDDGLVHMSASTKEIVDFNLTDIYSNSNVAFDDGPGAKIANIVSDVSVSTTDLGEIDISGGLKYNCYDIIDEDIINSTYYLKENQYIVKISNPLIKFVQLPNVADIGKSRSYKIIRNYESLNNEKWTNPSLKVVPGIEDTISLKQWVGIPVDSTINLLSDSLNTWKII